jgi:hypothetical protein
MCALAPLFACKGDDGGDEGAGTADSTGPGTDTGTVSDPTIDPTNDPTGDPDPTVDPDTSAGPGPESTTDDPTDATDPDTTTNVDPGELAAFRFNSIEVRDPHFFAPVIGTDVTDSNVNMPLNDALNTDGADGDPPPDGNLDLGLVVLFRPLDQADGGGADFEFANAVCTAPVETTTCDLFPKTDLYGTTYTNNTAGPCLAPNADELSDYGATAPPPPEATPGPCFESAPAAVVLQTMSFNLPLADASVAATYVGDPAGNLVTGNIRGFLSSADAASTMVEVPVFGVVPISDLLREEDMDGDGWRMHVAFTAETVEWTGS